ncbi:tRNA synthetases class I-domain-containing protein [Catenaria anguillulae PL171]|uniref:valine--tRNA ligase n=1 Tax=Catenaria anguillulae PL171 TaxID=765915 RepID=A0A1Y2HBK9_9FUNG|nr:tRNA synthetases class I-domain-containing protein [Catenaria anguillulae PL171]
MSAPIDPTAAAAAAAAADSAAQELSKNQLKNEAKKKAKMEKFLAKQAKQAATPTATADGDTSAAPAAPKKEKKKPAPAAAAAATAQPEVLPADTTPKGEKKDMSTTMASAYSPKHVEAAWDAWWEKQGYFKPRLQEDGSAMPRGTYVIPIPPPNVTGSLHLGHALTVSIQDTLTRWNRMLGKTVLYNPGCDHAGIATQSVVEKRLYKEQKITLFGKVWEWKELYGDRIYGQLRRLGTSGDWDRACFTMDPKLCKAVTEAFVLLHQEGVIYRATRLVNWCSHLNTALSNLEVENKELKGAHSCEFGVIISFAYPVIDSPTNEEIVVATTRIETMLGDTAIAVHPEDPRYAHLVGKHVRHPFIADRKIPIITDTYVDKDFGTGAVKITPAHDPNDYDIGKRHALEFINIMNDDGTLNENAGDQFKGMKRFDARYAVLDALKKAGLYRETKDNAMDLPVCSRSGDVIEPRLKPQWWVNCKDMAQSAMDAVRNGDLEIQPKASEKEWFRWLENIQDWCISRQLWWGHRIPAYLVRLADAPADFDENDAQFWVSGRNQEEAEKNARAKFPGKKFTLEQDPDTGWDILFFWVVRMVMMGIKLTGKVPFAKVFCHAMVRDAHGRKMSKSLGSLGRGQLDPREVEKAKAGQKQDYPKGIPECGTDALRFALCAYTSSGRDINLDIMPAADYKLPANWDPVRDAAKVSDVEKWILYKFNKAAAEVNANLESMNFMSTTSAMYQFWLYELCDVYLEAAKVLTSDSAKATLYTCLDMGLRMLHPIMPFVTEELWQRLPRQQGQPESIVIAAYPENKPEWTAAFEAPARAFDVVLDAVRNVRSLQSDYGVPSAAVFVRTHDAQFKTVFEQAKVVMGGLIKGLESVEIVDQVPAGCAVSSLSDAVAVALMVKGHVDVDAEVAKIEAKKAKTQQQIDALKKKMSVDGYETKVKADVRETNAAKLKAAEVEIDLLAKAIENFLKLKD